MNKRCITTTLALLLTVLTVAAGTKIVETKPLQPFTVLNILGSAKVVYIQGSGHSVRLEGDKEEIERLEIKQTDKHLNIGYKTTKIGGIYYMGNGSNNGSVTIYVTSPAINVINVTGSAEVEVDKYKVQTSMLTMNVTGSGSIHVKNASVGTATCNVAGSGCISVDELQAVNASLVVSGSGMVKAQVDCSDKLNCVVAGSGDVSVSGRTANYSKSVMGSGSVSDKKLKYTNLSNATRYDGKQAYVIDRTGRSQGNDTVNGIVANP